MKNNIIPKIDYEAITRNISDDVLRISETPERGVFRWTGCEKEIIGQHDGHGIHPNDNILPSCESFMNGKRFIIPILALCLFVSFSDLCSGKDKKSPLTVKRIVYTPDKTGGEWIMLFCNQSCTPELSSLEGENPRVVMDMKGVSLIQTKVLNVNTGGRLVKRIRSHLNKKTNILRIVLDLEPSKSYIVRPSQDPSGKYRLTIKEDADSPLSQEKHITILRPDLRPGEQQRNVQGAVPSPEKRSAKKTAEDVPSLDQGRSLLNDGEFAAAVDIFTQILVTHPNDSLIYRLRGDAYDNLGDQQKAVEDWTQAARLGDTIIQSYLDSLGVKWRETPTS